MNPTRASRLVFIDWLRGFSILFMIETHVFNSLLKPFLKEEVWFHLLNFFNGLVAPAGTPREVIERVRAEVAKAAAFPELHDRFKEQGIDFVASKSAEEFAGFLRKQVNEFAILARQAKITVN